MNVRFTLKKIFYLFILLLILNGCTGRKKAIGGKSAAHENNRESVVEIEAAKAEQQKVIPQISSFGNISFKSKTDISSAAGGIVRHIYVDIGNRVTPGTILALIENVQLKIEEQRAQAEIDSAKAAFTCRGKARRGEAAGKSSLFKSGKEETAD